MASLVVRQAVLDHASIVFRKSFARAVLRCELEVASDSRPVIHGRFGDERQDHAERRTAERRASCI